jgi:mRNA interferase RelE/StbE
VLNALERYLRDDVGDVKKLVGRHDEWRLRVGDWRVIFELEGDSVRVVAVLLRRDAYDWELTVSQHLLP